ncbi:hypothetical protein DY000_02005997 [Brassica cretica]|uniref:Uncharacterized protein n=1 Tax=Brassica cretica TaxID=69181 RepID=A0ABQ7BVC3_BRACR|nr:hypothetical protein DY000_02005997 [Brassica cretica]
MQPQKVRAGLIRQTLKKEEVLKMRKISRSRSVEAKAEQQKGPSPAVAESLATGEAEIFGHKLLRRRER